MTKHPSIYVAQ